MENDTDMLIKERLIVINDIQNAELDIYTRLNEKQLRMINHPEIGVFIAESPNVIERALNSGYEPISFLVEIPQGGEIADVNLRLLSRCPDTKVFAASSEVLRSLTGLAMTRGLLCAMKRKPLQTITEICRGKSRIAVLDDVENPTNVGAIIRSAAALGMEAVIITDSSADPLYRRAARVSMGTVFQIPWTIAGRGCIEELKALGFFVCAMALRENSLRPDDRDLKSKEKIALVLGSEGYGLEQEVIDKCDASVMIPMMHGVDSLNVASASAVAFWELGLV